MKKKKEQIVNKKYDIDDSEDGIFYAFAAEADESGGFDNHHAMRTDMISKPKLRQKDNSAQTSKDLSRIKNQLPKR